MYLEIIQYKYHDISTHLFAKYHIYNSKTWEKYCFVYADFILIYYDFTAGNKNMF